MRPLQRRKTQIELGIRRKFAINLFNPSRRKPATTFTLVQGAQETLEAVVEVDIDSIDVLEVVEDSWEALDTKIDRSKAGKLRRI